jgi:glyoxylate/hydroxypyruvate reductase A
MTEPLRSVLVYTKYAGDIPRFRELLIRALPGVTIAFATSAAEAEPHLPHANVLYGWGFPAGMVERMPNLRWIQKMGAGVEDLSGKRWPFGSSVLLTRTDGRLIAPRMVEYVAWAILNRTMQDERLRELRRQRRWEYLETGLIRQHTIGIAGLGEIGTEIATALAALGAAVVGWRRTPAACPAVSRVFAGSRELTGFLSACSVLVLVLPHTTETAGLIGSAELADVRRGCHLINVGRGGVVDEAALLAALDSGQLSHASLDVFAQEPLQAAHPFWTHPKVTMTPHIAGPLIPEDVVPHFVANFAAFREGRTLTHVVAPERQY